MHDQWRSDAGFCGFCRKCTDRARPSVYMTLGLQQQTQSLKTMWTSPSGI